MRCLECKHFLPVTTRDPRTGAIVIQASQGQPKMGFCKRYPPVALTPTQSTFPLTSAENSCGEFQADENETQNMQGA